MTNVPPKAYFSTNKMGRIMFLAMHEVLGRSGLDEALRTAGLTHRVGQYPPDNLERQVSFDELSQTQAALERLFGEQSGRGLAVRLGRACFRYGLHEFRKEINLGSLSFRLLPLEKKISKGIDHLAQVINHFSDQQVHLTGDERHYYWTVERCPVCWSRKSERPVCHLTVGVLDELLTWISGGKRYCVEEIQCAAQGDPACVVRLDKDPYE
jgi:predicted hydrocarbon binding protein